MPKRKLQPFRDIILKLDTPLQETISKGNLELYLDPSWHPEQHVTVTGIVYALPFNHNLDLKIGDTVCFSYQVVADRSFGDEPENYHPYINEENLKIFYNGFMEKIQIRAVQGIIAKKFICVHWDRFGEFDFGYEGTLHEMERWLAQFKFGNTDKFIFNNCIDLDGDILWKCRIDEIFAKKVGKKLIALNNQVIVNPVKMDLTKEQLAEAGIIQPKSTISATVIGEGNVESCPAGFGVKKGDKISFEDQYKQKYTFFGREYYLIDINRIEGIWN